MDACGGPICAQRQLEVSRLVDKDLLGLEDAMRVAKAWTVDTCVFSEPGHSVGPIARATESVNELVKELNASGEEASPFQFTKGRHLLELHPRQLRPTHPQYQRRRPSTLTGSPSSEDVRLSLEINVEAAFALSPEAVLIQG
ncbi:hypothetical protein H0H81_007255 [Sphagnurus paluster]|uniref:Uncharacterized protein n=1 Tax=Sphagnurus paluster TaxID=117069 RepID=A0A9P7FTA1_9AGAR|nr:hypothetical protein H0H81_007255 [Sphagnurus paluster]